MKLLPISIILVSLSGCASWSGLAQQGADVADGTLEKAEWVMCYGASVGSIMRRYGTDIESMAAWQTLCRGHDVDIFSVGQ